MSQGTFFWKKVETFIGRDQVVNDLMKMLQDDKFHLAPISGEFGYGKTRLLDQILRLAQEKHPEMALPDRVVDLYQTENHSPDGLAQALVNSFPKYASYFTTYEQHKKQRDEAQVAGNDKTGKAAAENMLTACAEGLVRLSAEHGLLILLDTAERWVYPSLENFPRVAPAWDWLKRVCGSLPRGMAILAGRPRIDQLGFNPGQIFPLPPFSEPDTRQYIIQTSQLFEEAFNTGPVIFSDDEIQTLSRLSEGRPILLALFLERVAHVDQSIRQATAGSSPQTFESLLIKHLMEDPQIGDILRAAGRAPKGLDLELLSEMLGLPDADLRERFDVLKGLSFAKTFPGNDRLFLHDEMYAMLARNVYEKEGDEIEADQAAQGLYRYYRKHTDLLNREIGRLYVEYAESESDDDGEKKKLRAEIDQAAKKLKLMNTDFAYYRWRRMVKPGEDPLGMGLRRYYRLAHEAATSNDIEMLVLLRFELIRFTRRLREKEQNGEPQPWLPFFQGFLLIQEVWEKSAMGQNKDKAADIETRLLPALKTIPNLTLAQQSILENVLHVWRGMSNLYMSDAVYSRAQTVFDEGISRLEAMVLPETSPEYGALNWFQKAALALAYRQRAYVYKRQGHFDDAIADFQRASLANRWLNFNFEEATIRNDLGDTQTLTGALDDANLNLKDAFDLRQKMKNGARLALSYSARARYFTARGAFTQAREYATRGMNLSNMVGRGTAFARVAYAEATIRYARETDANAKRQMELLNQAETAITEALQEINEPAQKIDALVELGSIHRDRMRIQPSEKSKADFQEANRLFLEVKDLGFKQDPPNYYRIADVMSNRIWLGLHARDEAFALQAAADFEQLDIFDFAIHQPGVFKREAPRLAATDKKPLLRFIGKYHAALGSLLLGETGKTQDANINEIAWHWMLNLEYNSLFASSYRGLDEARQTIFNKVKKFNQDELKRFSKAVQAAEKKENISNSQIQALMKQNSFWFDV